MINKISCVIFLAAAAVATVAAVVQTPSTSTSTSTSIDWKANASPPFSDAEVNTLVEFFMNNIDVQGSGAVMASPSTSHPDYFYHWSRDGAISINLVQDFQLGSNYTQTMMHYLNWVRQAQNQNDPNGIDIRGEPKFYLNDYGKPYDKPWGRPQNDGAALRVIALTTFANTLLANGQKDYVLANMYNPQVGACCGIKFDLEYIANGWSAASFDPWEEISGDHFFTKMVQRKALIVGAALANTLGDPGAGAYYIQQANALKAPIAAHWNAGYNSIMETPPGHGGPQKTNELDSAVLLGVLYGAVHNDSFYTYNDPQVLATLAALQNYFLNTANYAIQSADTAAGVRGVLFGRYPNDSYDGYQTGSQGNPWVLCTAGAAEIYYRSAANYARDGKVFITKESLGFFKMLATHRTLAASADLKTLIFEGSVFTAVSHPVAFAQVISALGYSGDDLLTRVHYHAKPLGLHLYEQINRWDGGKQGAYDLTWSYGTVISAMKARAGLAKVLKGKRTRMEGDVAQA